MVNAIGLRCYLVTAHRERNTTPLDFDDDLEFNLTPTAFLKNFVEIHASSVRDADRERSWYFETRSAGPSEGSSCGYVHYGTYGFESNLVNSRSKKKQYRRKIDDVEEIPLFYEFWKPEGSEFALASFQSFAGRSCVRIVLEQLDKSFREANSGYLLKIKKLTPDDGSTKLFDQAPVKNLKLIKRNASSDIAERYIGHSSNPIDIELTLKARRMQSLGKLGSISREVKRSSAGALTYEGIDFDEAVANIRVGGKYRPVGIFGINSDAGVIDITNDVDKGTDGHPKFDSIRKHSSDILADFNFTLSRRRQR